MIIISENPYNELQEKVRQGNICNTLDLMHEDPLITVKHIQILAINPNTAEPFFPQVPETSLVNSTLTLKVDPEAVARFVVENGIIEIICRFQGRETQLSIPVGLLIGIIGYSEDRIEPYFVETFNPYIINSKKQTELPKPKRPTVSLVK